MQKLIDKYIRNKLFFDYWGIAFLKTDDYFEMEDGVVEIFSLDSFSMRVWLRHNHPGIRFVVDIDGMMLDLDFENYYAITEDREQENLKTWKRLLTNT